MNKLRRIAIALVAIVVLGSGIARGASTTNFTDQWWNAPAGSESGWGASVLQQRDTLFFDIFVYGPGNLPTWFVAVATPKADAPAGHTVFEGDVYAVTGPYFGAPFNSVPVVERVVGRITFDADTATTAVLIYSVDGVTVVKNVTRQTLQTVNLSGRYFGGNSGEQTLCGEDNGHAEDPGFFEITHGADDSFTLKYAGLEDDNWTISGKYSQSGHLGAVTGTFDGGDVVGPAELFEIELSKGGLTARGHVVLTSGGTQVCVWDGRIGGVRR